VHSINKRVASLDHKLRNLLVEQMLDLSAEEAATFRYLLTRGCELNADVLAVLPDRHKTARSLCNLLSMANPEAA
jgi:hypothetical protein